MQKKFETPTRADAPVVSSYITIDSIYQKFKTYYVTPTVTPTQLFRFNGDVTLECTVTADEVSGNLYKTVYVQDATGGLKINLLNSGGLYVGDKIRINLNNVVLNDYGDVVQLDSINLLKSVYKLSSGNVVTPKNNVQRNQYTWGFGGIYKYQSQLVLLDSVEFSAGDKMETYADAVNKVTKEITLVNKNGGTGTAVVRNSGYSNFASSLVPCGSGSVVVIMGQFGTTSQLTLRSISDVKLSSGGCPLISKSFNDNSITSKGWLNYNVSGSVNWTVDTYNSQTYGYISNFISSANQACETWLISPPFDLTSAPAPYLTFQSAFNYTGPTLEVYVLSNYNSGNPNAAIAGILTPALSGGSWNWVPSGNVSLTSYIGPNKRIAFKYSGTSSNGSTWEVDDIAVFAQ
ncbi:MAG: choice-of-anchor J domain-containing protein [Sphingobacteriaceae bacterium]|nr:choice-of-anchor J domain-containing protein [Sphingobacteriaceae bacterium]